MARQLTDWLNAYLQYTHNSEPPTSYHLWTGIGIISSALQRRVYMKWGRSTLYPSLYIILVGPSGRAKKGTAFEFAMPILKATGVNLIQGAITREKLIRRMADAIRNFTDASDGIIKSQCAVTCFSGELSVFIGQQNIKFLADLCDWYDCPSVWKYDTKNMGTDKLDGVCFTLVGATAPDWLPSILPKEAIGGGFTSRVIWIVEEDKQKTVEVPTYDSEIESVLKDDLQEIYNITGEYSMSDAGLEWYKLWYREQDELDRKGIHAVADPQMSGYCERRATLIKKLGMVMSASETDSMVVDDIHLIRALDFMKKAEAKMSMHRLFGEMGAARYAIATEKVLAYVYKHETVFRSQIMNFLYRDVDLYTFKIVSETLEARGLVKLTAVPEQHDIKMEYTGKKVDW